MRSFLYRDAFAVATLVLSVLAPLRADPTDDEQKSLSKAEQSYKDGAFSLCNDRVAALLKKYPKTELSPQAELLQAQALYQLGQSGAALAALNLSIDQVPEELRSDFLFWQAESLLDLGRWPEAEQKYRALLALKNSPERTDAGNLGLAWALFKQGRQAEALPMIQALVKNSPTSPGGEQAQLLLAKIELAQKQSKDAIDGLTALLATKPEAGLAFQTEYWLGEAYAANAEFAEAVAAYEKITGELSSDTVAAAPPRAFPKTLVARAFLGLGRAEHELHQDDQSMLAYEQAYHLTENGPIQIEAFRAYLESARAARQLPEAETKLQEFAKTADQAAPAALLAIGTVLAEDGENDRAIGILESLLVAYANSSWVPAANYQLGLLYSQTGKPDQALHAFQTCIDGSLDPELTRTARFALGDALLNQTHDYAGAAAQFAQLATGTDATAENAAYDFLLAQAYQGKSDAFLKAETDFEKRFPKSGYLKKIALAEGHLLADAGRTDDAKDVYEKAVNTPGGGPDQQALLLALSDLQYQTDDLAGTLATCRMIVAQFPENSLIAAERAILVSYEMKKLTDDQAEQQLVALAQKFDKSPDAPEAYFRLGEFYYYRQDYVKAQDAFQQLTTAYPTSTYADNAYFFAGRAAAAHMDYAAALALLEKVPANSPFKADASLWEGRVYQQQLNFIQACTLADAVLTTEKAGPHFVEANLLKGHCLFEMGTKDPAIYPQALAAFDQILKGNEGTVSERNEAAVSSAKCLEKMGQTDKAMGLYLDVLYGRVAGNETSAAGTGFSWQIESGWQAGRIRQAQQDWRGAIEIYRQMEQIGGPHQQEFHDLVNKLRRDNYIYE
jgi:tetratricopeptide (TPR) repeat protein